MLDALTAAGWELTTIEELDEWWADDVWHMRSVWSPQSEQFYLTYLVDPQFEHHHQRKRGEGVWAVSASASLPASRIHAEGQLLFRIGHGWGERLSGFISDVAKFRHDNVA